MTNAAVKTSTNTFMQNLQRDWTRVINSEHKSEFKRENGECVRGEQDELWVLVLADQLFYDTVAFS